MGKVVSRLLLLAFSAFVLSARVAAAQDFYDQQLRAGKADFAAGRTVQAADELRIAAFGLLDRPPLLSEALVRLALAQNSLAQTPAVTQTLSRFLEVEQRFAAYASAAIDAPTRSSFNALLLKSEPRSELAGIPGLAALSRSDAAKVSDLPASERAAAYETGFRKSPRDVEWPVAAAKDAAARGQDEETVRWARRALSIDNGEATAQTLLIHALTHLGDCREALNHLNTAPSAVMTSHPELAGDQVVCLAKQAHWTEAEAAAAKLPDGQRTRSDVAHALELVSEHGSGKSKPASTAAATQASTPAENPKTSKTSSNTGTPAPHPNAKTDEALGSGKSLIGSGDYPKAAKLLASAVTSDPLNRDLRLALLEASTLSRDWRTAVNQIPQILPFKNGEEASMFYAAAALYENGRKEEARQMMERARPRLASSPMVDYYSRMILAQAPKEP